MFLHVDFANIKEQLEIQSAYFGHTGFGVFTACCYLKKRRVEKV